MPAIMWSRTLCLPACYKIKLKKKKTLKIYTELHFCHVFCIGMILVLVSYTEEHTLWMFENRMLRKIVWPKREEVTRDWRKMYEEELHELHCS